MINSCVNRIRQLIDHKRVGHAGTLDPMAEGILPIAVGRCTKLLQVKNTIITGNLYGMIILTFSLWSLKQKRIEQKFNLEKRR